MKATLIAALGALLILAVTAIGPFDPTSTKGAITASLASKGLAYVNSVALEKMRREITTFAVPNQEGNPRAVNIVVDQIVIPYMQTDIARESDVSGNAILTTILGVNAHIGGGWEYVFPLGWPTVTGNFDIQLSSVVTAKGTVTRSLNGPTFTVVGISTQITSFSIDLHSTIQNFIAGFADGSVRSTFESLLNSALPGLLQTRAQSTLNTLPFLIQVTNHTVADLSLVSSLRYADDAPNKRITAPIRGLFFYTNETLTGAPLTTNVFANAQTTVSDADQIIVPPDFLPNNSSMLEVLVSETTINSALFSLYKNGLLQVTFNSTIPCSQCATGTLRLNTDDFRVVVPAIASIYPDTPVILQVQAGDVPVVFVNETGAFSSIPLVMTFSALLPQPEPVPLLVLNATLSVRVQPLVQQQVLVAQVTTQEVKLTNVRVAVPGAVSGTDGALLFLFQALNFGQLLEPAVNALGSAGIPLPVSQEFQLVNTVIHTGKSVVAVFTDFILNV